MYSGTLNVSMNNMQDHNLFYWHLKNLTIPDAPLVVWVNGGPGQSSTFGLFLENGPLKVEKTGEGNYSFSVGLNSIGSWLDVADMVYLDQPVGTGFSYGNSYLTSLEDGTTEFLNFLVSFIRKYPEYKTRSIILAAESYAGKYLPQWTARISRYNSETFDNVPKDQQIFILLKAVLIGDPAASPTKHRLIMHQFGEGLHMIDFSNYAQVAALRRRCEQTLSNGNTFDNGTDVCGELMSYVDEQAGGRYSFNGAIFGYDWDPEASPVYDYLGKSAKKDDIYKALHIDQSTKQPIYESSSSRVSSAYNHEIMLDWS